MYLREDINLMVNNIHDTANDLDHYTSNLNVVLFHKTRNDGNHYIHNMYEYVSYSVNRLC